MLNFHFIFASFLTLSFSLAASFFYNKKFFKKDLSIAIIIYSLLIFNIVYFVSFDEKSIGLGIGLLGILSLIRLRSTLENLIDIGYVFYAITIGLLNASLENQLTILVVNIFIFSVLIITTSGLFFKNKVLKTNIVFDEIFFKDLGDKNFIKNEIKKKYNITPIEIEVLSLNYLKDSANLEVSYYANKT